MFTNKDLVHLKNLQRLLSKAKMELVGEEVLAAADVLLWVGKLSQRIEEDLQRQAMQAKLLEGQEKKETVKSEPPVEKPESLEDKPKRAKKTSA
jgi:hypothetical protein